MRALLSVDGIGAFYSIACGAMFQGLADMFGERLIPLQLRFP